MAKIIFFGTPDYVMPILEKLHRFHEVVAVVTQPPKPVGREKKLTYSPIDTWAHRKKIDIFFDFDNLPEADLGVLASYGGKIPEEGYKQFPKGILVVHPSILPQFRFSSPVPAAILTNTNPTGVTIFKMDEKFDHGPIVSVAKEEILNTDTNESLRNRLFEKSADILLEALDPYLKNRITPKSQDDTKATFARMLDKDSAFIPFKYVQKALNGQTDNEPWEIKFIKGLSVSPSPDQIERFIRAMRPWPGAWTLVNDKRLKILKAHLEENILVLDEVLLEGKTPVSGKQFFEARPETMLLD